MAVEQELAGLLAAALAIERECSETEDQVKCKRRERLSAEGEIVAAIAENGRKLEARVDEMLARMTLVQDELNLVGREHGACAEKEQAALRKAGESAEEFRMSLLRVHDMLALKRDPDILQMPTPPCVFTMDNFEERKANGESWFSPSFYSHPMGYKMCLRVYPNGNGNGQGTHISAFVVILPGKFDDLLSWPFCGTITVQILNQRNASKGHISMSVPMTEENSLGSRQRVDPTQAIQLGDHLLENLPIWGFPQFATHDQVYAPQGYFAASEYLKEDKLVFRVWKVDTFFLHH